MGKGAWRAHPGDWRRGDLVVQHFAVCHFEDAVDVVCDAATPLQRRGVKHGGGWARGVVRERGGGSEQGRTTTALLKLILLFVTVR